MQLTFPTRRTCLLTALLLAIGATGGAAAHAMSWPMPWMLGALVASGIAARFAPQPTFSDYAFPMRFRTVFVGLIGVMIGTQVTPDLLALAPDLPLTLGALLLFVPICHFGNMAIFQWLGGYDRTTAFYSGTPGGLMESIMMGEAAGADLRVLTLQQFLRIIFVISVLPLGLMLWTGQSVGSASGLVTPGGAGSVSPMALLLIVVTAIIGQPLAKAIRLPAAQLTGPLLLAAGATVSGLLDLHLPFWLIATAQLVIGASLGIRFRGVNGPLLRKSALLSLISVLFMLLVGAGFALMLSSVTGLNALHLLIAYAPGGVAEMSLVALSLSASPALVSLHHIIRILLTVVEMPVAARALSLTRNDI